jgi:ATP-dependent RNA helicase RhlE
MFKQNRGGVSRQRPHGPTRNSRGFSGASGSSSSGGYQGGQGGGGNNNRFRRNVPKQLDHRLFMHTPGDASIQQEAVHEVLNTFADFQIVDILKNNIARKQYVSPTPIQDQAIPEILAGKDVIGIANTGTGKTAAFLIPLINKAFNNPEEKILIVTPTRELALQIKEELHSFSNGMRIRTVLTIGGTSMYRQREELFRPFNFVIGTPGRLKDLIGERLLDLSKFHNVVLDEVDRMVDIGFIRDIEYLISLMPEERQSLFFSATVTNSVKGILNAFVKDPVTISVKTANTVQTVNQDVVRVANQAQKLDKLHDLLIQDGFHKVIVFGRTKRGVERLAKELNVRGFRATAIHGNKSQGQRQRALREFKNSQVQILLATDVASRGIDVDDVTHVINYDAPETYDDYVHRIGRTGRANKKGMAITFVEG